MLRRVVHNKPTVVLASIGFAAVGFGMVFTNLPGEDSWWFSIGFAVYAVVVAALSHINRPGYGYRSPPPPLPPTSG